MKLLFILTVGVIYFAAAEEELRCNFRTCGVDLLDFEHFGVSSVFRKLEIASFCVKNCTPPVLHEFFQSIMFAITKRIPGHCRGEECIEKNRFISLTRCAEERAWPLLQCSKRLIDLAQVGLVEHTYRQKRNYTCSIVVESTQCLEEKLQVCGPYAFSLVKEIFVDVVHMGLSAYCHPSYFEDLPKPLSTPLAPYMERMKYFTDIAPVSGPQPYPQFVKGYRRVEDNAAIGLTSAASTVMLVVGFLANRMFWRLH